jgi:2-polyprenyl-3-methyl-5-hydroxy-6-metoxy-1,4-benzoquinol methylase
MRDAEFNSMVQADDRHWWYRGRRIVVLREIERLALPPGAQILDAGCGSGRMMDELSRYGHAHGVDSSAWAVAAARARGHADVHQGTVERLPYESGTFDLVTCLDVIEHAPDDQRVLAELLRVTAPGGHLLVTVPAYQFLWSAHDEANNHYRRYRRRTLRDAALASRWQIERDTYFNSLLLAPAALVRIARKLRLGREGHSELSYTPRWLDSVLVTPFRLESAFLRIGGRLPAGLSLLAVLRKPAVFPTAGAVVVGPGAPARRTHEPAAAL